MRLVIPLLLAASTAVAEPARIEVEIDRVVEVEVGNLVGFQCDQPKLIEASMRTRVDKRGEVNVFTVKGVAEGTTQCRVGGHLGAFQLFDVVVSRSRDRKPR